MIIDQLMGKPLPTMPEEIRFRINEENRITLTKFESMNDVLENINLQEEVGYRKFEDGSYLVSMICPMPGITPEMINWWFWWHPQAKERYQVWFPGEHYSNSYSKKNKLYFEKEKVPQFQPNTQYPTEKIAGVRMPLRIDFVTPEEFGFSEQMMKENGVPLIVCGHVGAFNGAVWHTEMAHIFKYTNEGLFMISRFWIGKTLKNPMLRKFILTDKMAKGMAEHCCIEYRNLTEILPHLYRVYYKDK